MIIIIGCGGVGSWLAPALCLLTKPKNILLIDGDRLEKKNLNRQLFSDDDIGENKAEALARRYGCGAIPEWYSEGMISHGEGDWLIGAVDNHPARRSILLSCDRNGCRAIFGANETHSSEAYFYHPGWKDGPLDPRTYYPEIESVRTGDPRAAAIGCTGEAQRQNRQLVTANFMAAGLIAHLYVLWGMEAIKFDQEALRHLPFKLVNNLTRMESMRVNQVMKKDNNE